VDADLVITEFMASNDTTLFDEDGEAEDWLEIHNEGSAAIDLEGWHLTDDNQDLTQWTFPSVVLQPNEYLVVFASGKDRATSGSELHTNFGLRAGGEYLGLVAPQGVVVSEYQDPFPQQEADISYGLFAGAEEFFTIPTPGAANVLTPSGPPVGSDSACFEPVFDSATEQGVFLWRDCTGQWQVRVSNGGIPSVGTRAIGNVTSDSGFSSIGEFSLEGNDTLDGVTDPSTIDFNIRTFNAAVDGFNFIPNSADACFVLLGETRVPVSSPLNLETLASCLLPPAPAVPDQCGEPMFDRATEPGVFLWQDCAASGTDDVWNMMISGGGLPFLPYQGVLTSTNLVTATGIQTEANDILDVGSNGFNFVLNVANQALDGVDFTIPTGGQTCFDVQDLPAGAQIYVGRNRVVRTDAFNLEDLGICQ